MKLQCVIYITAINFLGPVNFYWKYGPSVIVLNVMQHFMSNFHVNETDMQISNITCNYTIWHLRLYIFLSLI